MKSYHSLAWREIFEQKIVSVLILAAIVLSTMMTAAVGQSVGVLSAMRKQQAIAIGGDRHATFVQLTEERAQFLERDSRLSYAGRSVLLGSMELSSLLKLDLAEYWNGGIETQPAYAHLVKGRLPEGPMEIALSEDALQFLGFTGEIGDTISLPLSKALRHGVSIDAYDYQADFVLTGITESNYLGYTNGSLLGIAGEGTAEAVLPPEYLYYNMDIRVADTKNFQSVMDDLGAELEIRELDTVYNGPYLRAMGISYGEEDDASGLDDSGFSYLFLVGVLVVVLVLTAAGLVIYNILKIAVARRIGGYGVLRAIGAEKGQLYRIVAKEVLLLCALGIPPGMLIGFLSARGILTAALNQLPPELFLAQDMEQLRNLIAESSAGKWEYLLLSAFITLFFAFLAAAPAARFAARVSPVMAMGRNTGAKIRRKMRKKKKIRGFERYYAWLNLRRNRGRTVITVLSLVMSITVFITLQGVLSLLGVAGAESEHLGDYDVVNEFNGFSPEELADMEADQNVAAVAAQQFSRYELDEQYRPIGIDTDFTLGIAEIFQIFGRNDEWMDYQFAGRLTEEQLSALKAGEGCVVRNPLPLEVEGETIGKTHIEEGRTITVAGVELPVLLSMSGYDSYFSVGSSGFINGVQVLVSDCLYSQLTGKDVY
ncbi:MAG: ABC transporter permease, partial [Lachnospiraceae bacterium]|nr:ABC transporter permease [Lachnospiraceae bacterium]